MKPWTWILLIIAVACLVSNFDPVGNALQREFGPDSGKWAILAIVVAIFLSSFLLPRQKK